MNAIATKLWGTKRIYNGGRSHLKFTSGVNFGHLAHFWQWLATFLQNVVNVAQSAADLLLVV